MTLYEWNHTATWAEGYYPDTDVYFGQSFTVGAVADDKAHTITNIKIKVARAISPGTGTVVLKAVDANGYPTGSALSTGTFNADTITTDTTNGEIVTVTMSSYVLQKSTKYAFYVYTSTLDLDNYLIIFRSTTDVYTSGNLITSSDGATWTDREDRDLYFEINGTVVACTAWTTESDCNDNGCYWYNDSCHAEPFFIRETFRSGYLRRFQNRQIFGHYSASGGGDLRGVAVNQSGHVYVDVEIDVSSGLHVVQQSGAFVQISGQHVYVESGVYVIADVEVDVSSGIHVQISGQHVYVESGVYLASGLTTVVESGVYVASGLSVVQESGAFVQISGQHVYVESGLHTLISGQWVYCASGASGSIMYPFHPEIDDRVITNSGIYETQINLLYGYYPTGPWWVPLLTDTGGRLYVNIQGGNVGVSGTVTVESGLGVLISGQHVYVESGVHTIPQSGVGIGIEVPSSVLINQGSGNPLIIPSLSGGTPLHSGGIISVVVKSLSENSGYMYIGGHTAGHMPFSGHGLRLDAGEAVNIDIDNMGKVRAYASYSGDEVSYLGVT